jgi:integrase
MAHLVRPWIYRYVKDGKRVSKDTPGAKRVKERARKWYGQGIPGLPLKKRVPLASDKAAAQQMLARMIKEAEHGQAGLQDSITEAGKRELSIHLETFERHLSNKPRSTGEKQIKLLLTRLRNVFAGCGFTYPSDLNADKVQDYLAERRRLLTSEGGISIQTSNFYLSALNQFCRWMCGTKPPRLADNPFAGIARGNVKLDRRHDRRNLSTGELGKLLDTTRDSKRVFRSLTGEDRYWLYLTCCAAGFRAAELATLAPESFVLDNIPATASLPARIDKAKRPVIQPLPLFLVDGLRAYLVGKPIGSPVWPGTTTSGWLDRAAQMLAKDLEAAGISYVVKGADGPLYADFHALRHSFITFLEQSGASPKTAQELARHSDIRLTLGRYTHANLSSLADAVQRLPLPGNDAAVQENAALKPDGDQLAGLVVVLGTVLGAILAPSLVAPPVAPTSEMDGDSRGQGGTMDDGTDAEDPAA